MSTSQVIIILVLFIAPLLVWYCYRYHYCQRVFLWRKKCCPDPDCDSDKKKKELQADRDAITKSGELGGADLDRKIIEECGEIIHYFDLVGEKKSSLSIQDLLELSKDSKDPSIPDPSKNIVAAIVDIENALFPDGGHADLPAQRALLFRIYDALSSSLSKWDNDITVETMGDAMDSNTPRFHNFNYIFGAVYVMVMTIILQSYSSSLSSYASEARKELARLTVLRAYGAEVVNRVLKYPNLKDSMAILRTANQKDTGTSIVTLFDSLRYVDSAEVQVALTSRVLMLSQRIRILSVSFFGDLDILIGRTDALADKNHPDNSHLLSDANLWIYYSDLVIDGFKLYVLPMLYGLIGAFLWVIRKMSDQTKTYDLTWKKLIRHRARLIFGMFVGMFFGYLYHVKVTDIAITSYVLAFVAGYQVEILFSILDKFVTAFTPGSDAKTNAVTDKAKT